MITGHWGVSLVEDSRFARGYVLIVELSCFHEGNSVTRVDVERLPMKVCSSRVVGGKNDLPLSHSCNDL